MQPFDSITMFEARKLLGVCAVKMAQLIKDAIVESPVENLGLIPAGISLARFKM